MGHLESEAAGDAKIEPSAHGLQKARIKARATIHQNAAWTGHITLEQVVHHTRNANRRGAMRGKEQSKQIGNR